MNKRGHFFVFEGIDGSGKTTQIHLLQKRIEQQGVRCMETKEPTLAHTAEKGNLFPAVRTHCPQYNCRLRACKTVKIDIFYKKQL